jgi:hypothetical protein
LINIFADPGEVFDGVRSGKRSIANWLVPVLVATVAGIVGVLLILSQPTVQQQMREAMEKGIDQQVAAGKMSAEQAKQFKETMEKIPPWVFQVGAVATGAVSSTVSVFWWALVVWLVGAKVFKSSLPFMKALEVSGLALMIFALSIVVTTLLVVILGNMNARPAPSFLLKEFDPFSKLHLFLAAINLFYLWWIAILALGLSRLSGVSIGKAALWMFGIWVVTRLAMVGAGLGNFVL